MIKLKTISVTLAMIFFTALNIYNLQRPVPPVSAGEKAYTNYAFSYLMYIGICGILSSISYGSGVRNRIINALLVINIGFYAILAIKAYFRVAYRHNYYDMTFVGLFVIVAIYYVIRPYKKDIVGYIKAFLNQTYRLWQNKREKPS